MYELSCHALVLTGPLADDRQLTGRCFGLLLLPVGLPVEVARRTIINPTLQRTTSFAVLRRTSLAAIVRQTIVAPTL